MVPVVIFGILVIIGIIFGFWLKRYEGMSIITMLHDDNRQTKRIHCDKKADEILS